MTIARDMNKYRNTKCEYNGLRFDSQAEMRRYQDLLLMEKAGEITGLEVHPRFVLEEAFKPNGKRLWAITYVGDFAYTESGKAVCEDVKPYDIKTGRFILLPVFKIKANLFARRFPDIELRVVR